MGRKVAQPALRLGVKPVGGVYSDTDARRQGIACWHVVRTAPHRKRPLARQRTIGELTLGLGGAGLGARLAKRQEHGHRKRGEEEDKQQGPVQGKASFTKSAFAS